jgi:hypothetical protein
VLVAPTAASCMELEHKGSERRTYASFGARAPEKGLRSIRRLVLQDAAAKALRREFQHSCFRSRETGPAHKLMRSEFEAKRTLKLQPRGPWCRAWGSGPHSLS